MSIVVLKNNSDYIGRHVVYFDGATVSGARIVEVHDIYKEDKDYQVLTVETRFVVELDGRGISISGVSESDLYMNWNSWMRSVVLDKRYEGLLDVDAQFDKKLVELTKKALQACKVISDDVCCCINNKCSRWAVDAMVEDIRQDVGMFNGILEKWDNELKNTKVGFDENDWQWTLNRLLAKQKRKDRSREIRAEWRHAHAVQ